LVTLSIHAFQAFPPTRNKYFDSGKLENIVVIRFLDIHHTKLKKIMDSQMNEKHEKTEITASGMTETLSGNNASGMLRWNNRRILFRLLAVVLVIVVLGVGIPIYIYLRTHVSTDDAFIEGHIIPISPRVAGHVAVVHVNDNQRVKAGDLLIELAPQDFEAQLKAAEANLTAARASYQTSQINVDLTTVTATSSLDEAQANMVAANAQVETAQATASAVASQREQARAQLDSARAALAQAKAEVASAEAAHQRDVLDLQRAQELVKSNVISKQELDHALAVEKMSSAELTAAEKKVQTQLAVIQQAEAGLKAAEDNLRQAQAQVSARQAQMEESRARLKSARSAPKQVEQSRSRAEAAKADIERAQALVEQARLNLSYTRITAPADGFVTEKAVEPGAYVLVGQSLMTIVPSDVWVLANFKETQLTRMHPGQPVKVVVDTYPGVVFQGHVDSIQHGTGARFSLLPPENATGNFVKVVQRLPVKIVFDRREQLERYLLAPGMSVVPKVNVGVPGRVEISNKIPSGVSSFKTSANAQSNTRSSQKH